LLYSVPHPGYKSFLWEHLTNPELAMSLPLFDYNTMLRVFFQPFISYHLDMYLPYASMFYQVVPHLMAKLDRSRARAFLFGVCPAIRGEEEDKKELKRLLQEV
jgi:hypothetical protein